MTMHGARPRAAAEPEWLRAVRIGTERVRIRCCSMHMLLLYDADNCKVRNSRTLSEARAAAQISQSIARTRAVVQLTRELLSPARALRMLRSIDR
jgi:hypothetical protein